MNAFKDWSQTQVDAHNLRVSRAKAELAKLEDIPSTHVNSEIRTDLIVRPSTDEAKLNKLEKAWLAQLRMLNYPFLGIQSITFKLGDDCRYTPDFVVVGPNGEMIAYETKGFFRDDALVKVKVAARTFRFLKIIIVTREKGIWKQQEIKP